MVVYLVLALRTCIPHIGLKHGLLQSDQLPLKLEKV